MKQIFDIPGIFADALDMAPDERSGFIGARCAGNSEAQCEIEQLLREHDRAASEDFLSKGALEIEAEHIFNSDADQRVGQTFGRYQAVRRIGAGGMGTIYVAVRRDDFEKQAAVKIINRGMDTDAILRRFRNERQILATLEHPNIAHLIDGGTTGDGLPFFVMEYVDGTTIRDFCGELGQKEVLRLFLRVCSAVSFAHQKLVVHRDLKPSNILVDKHGEPKLLDFGIAKLLNQTGQEETHTVHRMMTPAYASPEQLAGAAVSTSMDVYSLGTILAELLVPDNTNGHRRRLDTDLQKVLDTAQHEDVELRYASVERFADDIRRFLDDLPVSARKVSLTYRARKFARRNRAKVAFAALFLLTLIGGLAATTWKTIEARHERALAERRFENLRRLSDSFVTELHSAIQNLPGSLPARQLLLKRATEQLDSLAAESGDNRELRLDLANAYFNLSSLPDMDIAEKARILAKADSIKDSEQDPVLIRSLALTRLELADTRKVQGSVADGIGYAAAAVDLLERLNGIEPNNIGDLRDLRDASANLGGLYLLAGNADKALALTQRTLELSERIMSSEGGMSSALLVSRAHMQMGHVRSFTGDDAAALNELNAALAGEDSARVADPNDTSIDFYRWAIYRRMAIAYRNLGDNRRMTADADESLSIMASLLRSSPTDVGYNRNTAISHLLLGQIDIGRGEPAAAIPHYRRALELSEYVINANPAYLESKIDVARSRGGLGHALWLCGEKEKGLALLREALATFDETSRMDVENAGLWRDYAETAGWTASALAANSEAEAAGFRETSNNIWRQLLTKGQLSTADRLLASS